MSVPVESIHKLDIFFDAGENVPAPYHYAYHLQLSLKEEGIEVAFDLRYLHREELTQEEIYEEGFTLEDDWSWQGALPQVWLQALKEQLQKSLWPNKPKESLDGEALLEIQLLGGVSEVLFSGRPADPASWEYFLQELMQGIYEVAQKEAPLSLHYKEIDRNGEVIDILVEASFAERKAKARQQGMAVAAEQELSWSVLKKLLKTVYMPEYDADNADEEAPTKPGNYLNMGDGLWYAFGEGMLEPSVTSNSLDRLVTALKFLFKS